MFIEPPERPASLDRRSDVLRYLTIAGGLCALAAPFLPGGATRADGTALVWFAGGVVAAVLLGLSRSRKVRIAGAGLGVVAFGAATFRLVLDVQGGLPGWDTPVLAVGALGAVIGLLDSSTWRVRPIGVAAVAAVLAAAAAAPVLADEIATRTETRAARDYAPEPVAEVPGSRQWSWQPPADVSDVVAAGHGVVVASTDGSVTALNGSDGRQDWRYARPGAQVRTLLVSADRRAVLAAFASTTDTSSELLVMLDADTGAARFEKVVPSVLVQTGQVVLSTRTMTIRDDAYTAYDVDNGAERWRWSPPAGCTEPFSRSARGRSVVFAPLECDDSAALVALDEMTGHERWRHEVKTRGPDDERLDVLPAGTADGAAVWVRIVGRVVAPGSVTNGLFDTETGRLLARPGASWWLRTDVGVTPLLEQQEGARPTAIQTLDPATGSMHPLDVGSCPDRAADATTARAYLRACQDNGRELTLIAQFWDGTAPTTRLVRMDGSGAPSDLHLVPAPGAIVLARTAFGGTPAPVVGFSA